MKKGKYDAGVIEKLIDIVRQHPVLYDAADDNYSNQDIKNNIWESIQKKMNMANVTAKQWKKEWSGKRDAYVKKRKEYRTQKSGQKAKIVKTWQFFHTMIFLDPFLGTRSSEMEMVAHLPEYEEAATFLRTKTMDLEIMWTWISDLEKEGRLDDIARMMDIYFNRVGISQDELDKLPIIHIAGTKGKGSTSGFTESILRHHGYKTGLFVSPHLVDLRERICINGRPLSQEKFCKYFWEVYGIYEKTSVADGPIGEGGCMPAMFDMLVIMAMRAFLSEGVDVVVLEVGKGGKTDRTNFVRSPVVCAITPLELEHTDFLGKTIGRVAWHKAGIVKTGRPVITAPQDPEALEVILDIAKQKQAPVSIALPLTESTLEEYKCQLGIQGQVQLQNAAMAVQLFKAWQRWKGGKSEDMTSHPDRMSSIKDIPRLSCRDLDSTIIKGLTNCRMLGRGQVLKRGKVTFYLDFAHTEDSMQNCTRWFDKMAKEEAASHSGKVVRVLHFFCFPDKDEDKMFPLLKAMDFQAVAFSVCKISKKEPLGQRIEQCYISASMHDFDAQVHKLSDTWHRRGALKNEVVISQPPDFIGAQNGDFRSKTRSLQVESSIENSKDTGEPATHTFHCALQALMWLAQNKDPFIKSCMTAPLDVLPPAPAVVKDADHVQVLVTGSSYLVGVVLSIIAPHING